MKTKSPIFIALAQALGVIAYCFLVVQLILTPNGPIFFKLGEQVGAVLFLTTFVFSVATVGLIIFGYPIYLAFKGEPLRGLKIASLTAGLGILIVFSVAVTVALFLR